MSVSSVVTTGMYPGEYIDLKCLKSNDIDWEAMYREYQAHAEEGK